MQPPAYPKWLSSGEVKRLRWDDAAVEGYLRSGTPLVLTGCPVARKLVGRWSFDYLADHYDGPPTLNVHFAPRKERRFSRFYGEGAGKGGIIGMSFRQFVNVARKNERERDPPWRHYMQALCMWAKEKACQSDDGEQRQCGGKMNVGGDTLHHAPLGEALTDDLRSLDYDWLRGACAQCGCDGLMELNLWVGASGGVTPVHYDGTSNFLCQLTGRKRLLLFSPAESWRLYPYPATHPMYAFAMVDIENPDLDRFPSFQHCRGVEAVLEPGDALFLPSHWWHYVKQFDGEETISLNFWIGARRNDRGDAALTKEKEALARGGVPSLEGVAAAAAASLNVATTADPMVTEESDDLQLSSTDDHGLVCMQMGGFLEKEAIRMFGGEVAAGHFLTALALGVDTTWPAESAEARTATQMRSHLIMVLGVARANALLRLMTRHGRLHPGLAPKLGGAVVGTDEHNFSSVGELRQWVKSGDADPAVLKANLL